MPRLTKIYTRQGDQGLTGLGDGQRVAKNHARVETYGTVDELNSVLGLLLTESLPPAHQEALLQVQHRLFDLGGELSIPGRFHLQATAWQSLEQNIDEWNRHLPVLAEFILPGGSRPSALCHVARTICRRAERHLVTLSQQEAINPQALIYLNRLSDWLFVLARVLNQTAGIPDILWQPAPHTP